MSRPMTISTIVVDSSTNNPIVILKDQNGEDTLPIWIGPFEANAIASALQGMKFPRPMTHDLLKNIISMMDVTVNRVEICDLQSNTYYALIYLNHNGREIPIDARPSDALALSLRMDAPIFVSEDVLSKSRQVELKVEAEEESGQQEKWQDILDDLNPDDIGK